MRQSKHRRGHSRRNNKVNGFLSGYTCELGIWNLETDSHSDCKVADVRSGTPFYRPDLPVELPSLNFTANVDFPQTHVTILVSTNDPGSVRAYARTPCTTLGVREAKTAIVGERFQAAGAGQLRNERLGIDVEFYALNTRCKVEIELSAKALLDELVVSGDVSQ
jgi:hypothetical protein